jgi:hypothetical protein
LEKICLEYLDLVGLSRYPHYYPISFPAACSSASRWPGVEARMRVA